MHPDPPGAGLLLNGQEIIWAKAVSVSRHNRGLQLVACLKRCAQTNRNISFLSFYVSFYITFSY